MMAVSMNRASAKVGGSRRMASSAKVSSTRARRVPAVVRAEANGTGPSTSAASTTEPFQVLAPVSSDGGFQFLGATQEAINGRAAMLGFVAAVAAESLTHQAVWSQIAGRYANAELIEKPIGVATLLFGATVALITMATLVPTMVAGAGVDSKSFGPFTPGLEKTLGRVAMMGFSGLLIVELIKGSSLL